MEFAFNRPFRADDSYLNHQRQEFFFDYPLYRARRRGWYARPFWRGARGAGAPGDPPGQPRGLADPRFRRSLRHSIQRGRAGAPVGVDPRILWALSDPWYP